MRYKSISLFFLFVALLLFPILGFAMSGDTPANSIPIPQKDYKVNMVDNSGTKNIVSRLTWNGKIFLEGNVGLSKITVDFDKIKSIEVFPTTLDSKNRIDAKITLKNGEDRTAKISAISNFVGETSFGTLKVLFKDVNTVEFE